MLLHLETPPHTHTFHLHQRPSNPALFACQLQVKESIGTSSNEINIPLQSMKEKPQALLTSFIQNLFHAMIVVMFFCAVIVA